MTEPSETPPTVTPPTEPAGCHCRWHGGTHAYCYPVCTDGGCTPDLVGVYDPTGPRCFAAANLKGEHIPCDLTLGHNGWGHTNRAHELIWSNA